MRLFITLLTAIYLIATGQDAHAQTTSRLIVDGTRTTNADKGVFATVNEALKYVEYQQQASTHRTSSQSTSPRWTDILIQPGVYWIDDPDDPTVRRATGGGTPFGLEANVSRIRLIGQSDNAEDIVIACNRGQTQGAVGNYTMLGLWGDSIEVSNITFGNYCNIDLVYPRDHTLDRPRRADAIVQAQLIIANGTGIRAHNCQFLSRLNSCPFAGARLARFDRCYFECTDDALCGSAIYSKCRFTLYSSKPFYSTSAEGAILIDCDIHTRVHGTQYLTKVPAPVFMSECRWTSDDPNLRLQWTPYPTPLLKCYQQGITLNGSPVVIGDSANTVIMPRTFFDESNLGNVRPLTVGQPHQTIEADIEHPEDRYITISDSYGRQAVSHLRIMPTTLQAPRVVKPIRTRRKGNTLLASYEIDTDGHEDCSEILWYRVREGDSILVLQNVRQYLLTDADRGWNVVARLVPHTNRHPVGARPVIADTASWKSFPTVRQPRILPGFWTIDTYKPADTNAYSWSADSLSSGWTYGRGTDGALHAEGLIQTRRGARLMYTPVDETTGRGHVKSDSTSITIVCTPCKSAGQGFGSATAQYMDIALGMDTHTLTGYALRIVRTPHHDKAVDFMLMSYRDGIATPVGKAVTSGCFARRCTITVTLHDNLLTATATNGSDGVKLSATVIPTASRGYMIQHTGTVGAGATVIEDIKAEF